MRLKQLSPEKIREYANYLDGCRDILPFKRIVDGRTTLEKTVENFYDIEDKSYVGRGPVEVYKVMSEDLSKKGKIPQELLHFLSRFRELSLNTEHLVYEKVRQDVKHFNRCQTKAIISLPLGMIGGIFGLPILAQTLDLNSSYGFVGGIAIPTFTLWYNFFGMGERDRVGKVAFVNLKEHSEYLENKEKKLIKERESLSKLIPELEKLQSKKEKQEAEIF